MSSPIFRSFSNAERKNGEFQTFSIGIYVGGRENAAKFQRKIFSEIFTGRFVILFDRDGGKFSLFTSGFVKVCLVLPPVFAYAGTNKTEMEAEIAVDIGKNTRFSSDENGDGTAREAGIASGKSRRNKKSLQALAQALLESGGGLTEAQKEELSALGMEPTQGAALVQAMHKKALKGSERAAEFVRDTSGQKPETQAHITVGEGLSPAEIRGLTDAELQSILDGD